jgi:hypothetical protein
MSTGDLRDRQKIVQLCDALLRDGEPRYCLTRSEAFFTRCGDFWRLRWLTYEAHKRLSGWDPAIAEVTRLITQFSIGADTQPPRIVGLLETVHHHQDRIGERARDHLRGAVTCVLELARRARQAAYAAG